MEELLKIAYRNFMDTKDMNNSEEVCIINNFFPEKGGAC